MLEEKAASKIAQKKLPYSYDTLAPALSRETLECHYGKHYVGYLNKLNELIESTPYAEMTLEEIVKGSEGAIFNNAAQVWNHEFYFAQLSATPKKRPEGELLLAIEHSFGSFENFLLKFKEEAAGLFGSGWVWLVEDPMSSLLIEAESNAGTPLTRGLRPLLTIDVWEHAYYLDYQNRRAEAVEKHLAIVDWEVIEGRYVR